MKKVEIKPNKPKSKESMVPFWLIAIPSFLMGLVFYYLCTVLFNVPNLHDTQKRMELSVSKELVSPSCSFNPHIGSWECRVNSRLFENSKIFECYEDTDLCFEQEWKEKKPCPDKE